MNINEAQIHQYRNNEIIQIKFVASPQDFISVSLLRKMLAKISINYNLINFYRRYYLLALKMSREVLFALWRKKGRSLYLLQKCDDNSLHN